MHKLPQYFARSGEPLCSVCATGNPTRWIGGDRVCDRCFVTIPKCSACGGDGFHHSYDESQCIVFARACLRCHGSGMRQLLLFPESRATRLARILVRAHGMTWSAISGGGPTFFHRIDRESRIHRAFLSAMHNRSTPQ